MTHFNKLVRDKIPAIIIKSGQEPTARILSEDEYHQALIDKLHEEVAEYAKSKASEELADILEVAYALAETAGLSPQQLEDIREQKAEQRGGFTERIFLEQVKD